MVRWGMCYFVGFVGLNGMVGSLEGRTRTLVRFGPLFAFMFDVSLWASVSKTFCNYSISAILHRWSPFL